MKKLLLILPLILCVAGCDPKDTPQIVVKDKFIVVSPPPSFYGCPVVNVPKTEGISNAEIARYIIDSYQANVTCRNNMKAIKAFVTKAKQVYN